MTGLLRRHLIATTFLATTFTMPAIVHAQAVDVSSRDADGAQDIVVTGSRIRRSNTDTTSPVTAIDSTQLVERGYVQAGEALNTISSIAPSFAEAAGSGTAAGNGQQYPNLFALGAGRTLTLVNGRRMVTTGSGLGDRVVDSNIIPTGLIDRIDIVQGGGAAVYGSDAIAGVVNYVLKKNFKGLTLDAQSGISSRGDYPRISLSAVGGTDFADGRGNIALDVEYRKTDPLFFGSRPIVDPVFRLTSNPLNKTATDGIPSRAAVFDPHFWVQNETGVVFTTPAPVKAFLLNQFSADGRSVTAFDQGTSPVPGFNCSVPFCTGGDGYSYNKLQALFTGVQTATANLVGHFDITPALTVSTELTYAHRIATDPLGAQSAQLSVLNGNSIAFTRDNPFLTSAAVAALSVASPGFLTGSPLYLSKVFEDLLPTRRYRYASDVYRGVLSIDGHFETLGRRFDYGVSFSHAEVKGRNSGYGASLDNLSNATDVVRNAAGQIVCRVNAVSTTDPACAPLNAFGTGNISAAAKAYTVAETGLDYRNRQDDLLATLTGDLWRLPAGSAKFSVSYEHRAESARNTPFAADQQGFFNDSPSLPTSRRYNTDEIATELLVPIIAPEMSIPLVRRLTAQGQYRSVSHSIAGHENVWGVGGQWEPGLGITFRVDRSRNFRAPTLDQLYAPSSTVLQGGINDPCDARFLNAGTAPATRASNCTALFAANPRWGPLATFTDPAVNFANALVTTGGNADLANEVSDNLTFGATWQPRFVPGALTLSADRIQIDIKNGLTSFSPTNFVEACLDASPQPQAICAAFTRDPATGYIITARNTTFNAALVQYRGIVIGAEYRFPVGWLAHGRDMGTLELGVDATRNERLRTIVAGVTTERAGTTVAPDWVLRGDVRYRFGGLGISYEIYYLPEAKVNSFDTIETTPFPTVAGNTRHSISAQYDVGKFEIRVGVNNFTDKGPSRATVINYGDVIGRQVFVGARVKL